MTQHFPDRPTKRFISTFFILPMSNHHPRHSLEQRLCTALTLCLLVTGQAFAGQVPKPTISVNSSRHCFFYLSVSTVTGATAHYTTDGTMPSELSPAVPASGIVRVADADLVYNFQARAWLDGSDPSEVARTVPWQGSPLQNRGRFSAGETHSLAVLPGGLIEGWGSNGQSRLGNTVIPPLGQTTKVVRANGEPFGNVVDVMASWQSATAHGFSLALVDESGTGDNLRIYAWGANNAGQLGNYAFPPGPLASSAAPVAVLNTNNSSLGGWLSNVSLADLGEDFGVAMTADGAVHAWGQNALGQLGTGTAGAYRNYTAPVQSSSESDTLAPLSGQKTIVAGARHTLSIGTDNRVWAWGITPQSNSGKEVPRQRISPSQNW